MSTLFSTLLSSPMAVHRRLSANAQRVADLLIQPFGDATPDAEVAPPPMPAPAATVRPKASAATKPQKRSPPVRVKQEASREMPFRAKRHKSGFYAETNLCNLAWKGEGTRKDPIQL